jgi:hypothetical protein
MTKRYRRFGKVTAYVESKRLVDMLAKRLGDGDYLSTMN